MKFPRVLSAAACAMLLASCASPVARRIEKHPEIFNKLGSQHQAIVRQGRIEEGMDKGAVWLAWGKPDRIATGSRSGRACERWSYSGYEPVYGTSFGIGFGGGYWGSHPHAGAGCFYDPWIYSEPAWTYLPYEARSVEFVAGKVNAWAVAR